MKLIYENKKALVKIIIDKQKLKEMILKINSNYKKYMENYINKNYNESFGDLTLLSYFLLLKTKLFEDNPNIKTDLIITHDKNNFYIRIVIDKFYDRDLTKYNNEQLEFLINTQFDETEKIVLEEFINLIPTEDFIENNIHIFIDLMFNVDDLIKKFKENIANNKENKEEVKRLSKEMEFRITERLFSSYSIVVIKNMLKENKEFMEKEYGKEKK